MLPCQFLGIIFYDGIRKKILLFFPPPRKEKKILFMVYINFLALKFSVLQPHQDGPAYYPVVAILSLGSPVVMAFTPHSRLNSCKSTVMESVGDKTSDVKAAEIEGNDGLDKHQPFSVLLMPRSLLIFKDDAYSGKLMS